MSDLRAEVEGDKSIDLDTLTEHSLNDKFQDRMRELVQRYERMQATRLERWGTCMTLVLTNSHPLKLLLLHHYAWL